MSFASIPEAIEAFRRGEFLIVADDEDRENEGDLIIAAEMVTAEKLAFMVRYTSGVICMPMEGPRLEELQLPQMVNQNTEAHRTAFTVSVDYRHGTSTGISASDRCKTIKALANPQSKPVDFHRPGHIFPLRARPGGVLKRAGHTEAAVDLAKLSGLSPNGVLCELVNDDGTMMRIPQLKEFGKEHGLLLISIADLVRFRRRSEKLVERESEASIPTEFGTFRAIAYRSLLDGIQHLAIVKGEPSEDEVSLVRVHSECLTGDIFGSRRCDCGSQLQAALKMISERGSGAVIYLRGHEGRGIGIAHKLRAYELQDAGADTVEANEKLGLPVDSREYGIGAQILVDLGISKMELMTNNPAKYGGLDGFGLEIVGRVPLESCPTPENSRYLKTKKEKMGHLLNV